MAVADNVHVATFLLQVMAVADNVHVATFLLQVMAVADNVFLTTTALSQMTMALTMYTETSMAAAAASSPSVDIDQRPLNDLYAVTAYVQVRRTASPLCYFI